jgi:hypothetical protein
LVRACNPHTHRGLYNQLDELKLIMGDGPDPMHHLGHLPLAVRMFVEWVGEQYQRYMRSQTPEHVEAMVARWLLVRDETSLLVLSIVSELCDIRCRWAKPTPTV